MPTAKQDSHFAESILEIIKDDPETKIEIAKAAQKLRDVVITAILNKLEKDTPLDMQEEQSIDFLITEHSLDGIQREGTMHDYSGAAIKDNQTLQKELLKRLFTIMDPDKIKENTEIKHLSKVMKAVTDCAVCYVEKLAQKKVGPHKIWFENLCEWVLPTQTELDIRVYRTKIGEPEHLAITYGLGMKVGTDIIPRAAVSTGAYRAGKSAFAFVDVYQRTRLVVNKYDATVAAIREMEARSLSTDEIHQLAAAKIARQALEDKMVFYKIPLNPVERPEDFIKRVPMPSIQHLAKWGTDLVDGTPLPLIASTSATAAKTLIALHDLGLFYDPSGIFQPRNAGYLTTVLCGTLIHGGHHSVLEIGEVYNRLIDYEAVRHIETIAPSENTGLKEELMPYYHIGDSISLVPEALRGRILAEYCRKNQMDFKGIKQTMHEKDPSRSKDQFFAFKPAPSSAIAPEACSTVSVFSSTSAT